MNSAIDLIGAGSIVVVEAPAGRARREHLATWIEQASDAGATAWLLECHRASGGAWAGVRDLLRELLPAILRSAPDLAHAHDAELALVLPELRRSVAARHPSLTRAPSTRVAHGLVDLLAAWHERSGAASWAIACDDFEHAGALVRLFFAELARRRGAAIGLRLILAVAPGEGAGAVKDIDASVPREHVSLALPPDPPPSTVDPIELARRARTLAQSFSSLAELEAALPRVIRHWEAAGDRRRAMFARIEAASFCARREFHEDALHYGEIAAPELERIAPDDAPRRLFLYGVLASSYAATGRAPDAIAMAEKAFAITRDPRHLASFCYVAAMAHARRTPSPDFDGAERAIDDGLRHIDRAGLPSHVRLLQRAIHRSGLAMIRRLQGRHEEAIALSRASFDELEAGLAPHEHRLHRSVLLRDVALAAAAIGRIDESISAYTAAIGMTPDCAEYYDERGTLYLETGCFDEAARDFLRAIEQSSPYAEVWTKLGRCYAEMRRPEDALAAYARAIDLDPRCEDARDAARDVRRWIELDAAAEDGARAPASSAEARAPRRPPLVSGGATRSGSRSAA